MILLHCCCEGAADGWPRVPTVLGDLDPTPAPALRAGALLTRSFQSLH